MIKMRIEIIRNKGSIDMETKLSSTKKNIRYLLRRRSRKYMKWRIGNYIIPITTTINRVIKRVFA